MFNGGSTNSNGYFRCVKYIGYIRLDNFPENVLGIVDSRCFDLVLSIVPDGHGAYYLSAVFCVGMLGAVALSCYSRGTLFILDFYVHVLLSTCVVLCTTTVEQL